MGIERAPQLDIDNPNAVDAHPVFFTPVPDTPDFRRAIAEQLREYCQGWGDDQPWDHCPDELQHIDRLSCACRVIDMLGYWGHHAISTHDLHPADIPKWRKAFAGTGAKLPSYTGSSVYLKKHGDRPPQPLLEWFTPSALYISNKTKGMRHWVGYVADNTSHKKHLDEALRSEITSAISFIRRRIQATRDTHSTIPVLVISFYHNDTVRITQVCWNGEHNPITFRQSRLVDIASDSFDTPDIFLLMRWMQCLPLREPKVSRRQATAATRAPTLRPGRPTTPVQKGAANNAAAPAAAHAARTATAPARPATPTPTSTPTQKRAGTTSGSNSNTSSPPRSATPTPTRRASPSSNTGSSPPRAATPTPMRSTPNNNKTTVITTPTRNAATPTATTTAALAASSNAAAARTITPTPQQTGSPPSVRNGTNAPPAPTHQRANLPTRSAHANGGGSGGGNGNCGGNGGTTGPSHAQHAHHVAGNGAGHR